jgi:hypothetical protein
MFFSSVRLVQQKRKLSQEKSADISTTVTSAVAYAIKVKETEHAAAMEAHEKAHAASEAGVTESLTEQRALAQSLQEQVDALATKLQEKELQLSQSASAVVDLKAAHATALKAAVAEQAAEQAAEGPVGFSSALAAGVVVDDPSVQTLVKLSVMLFLLGFSAGYPFYVPQSMFAVEFGSSDAATVVGCGECVQSVAMAAFIVTAQR